MSVAWTIQRMPGGHIDAISFVKCTLTFLRYNINKVFWVAEIGFFFFFTSNIVLCSIIRLPPLPRGALAFISRHLENLVD